jgi:Na+/H+ antiporter NhaB
MTMVDLAAWSAVVLIIPLVETVSSVVLFKLTFLVWITAVIRICTAHQMGQIFYQCDYQTEKDKINT